MCIQLCPALAAIPNPASNEQTKAKAEQHEVDDLRRVLLGGTFAQACDLKKAIQSWKR
jgi:hypothetical protein